MFPVVPANSSAFNGTIPNPSASANSSFPVVTVRVKGTVPVTLNAGWLLSQVISAITGAVGSLLQGAGDKLAWFALYVPTPSSVPAIKSVYSLTLNVALVLFALALIAEVLASLIGGFGMRPADPVIALLGMLFGLQVYSELASLLSSVAYYVLNSSIGLGSAAQMLTVEFAAMSVVPGLNLLFFAAVVEFAVVSVFRIIATAALAAFLPIIVLMWMVPPLRGLATDFLEGLLVLLLLSPLSAVYLAIGMGSAMNALSGGNPFLDFALSSGTLVGVTVLPAVLVRGGRGVMEAGRTILRRGSR